MQESSTSVNFNSQWKHQFVDANFLFLVLGQNCTYKTNNTLGQDQESHDPTMNGGALAKEPPMPKLEFREKSVWEFWRTLVRVWN